MGKDTSRFMVAFVLSLAVMFLWSSFMTPAPKPGTKTPAPQGATAPGQAAKPAASAPPAAAAATVAPTEAAPAPETPEETVALEGNGFTATFSTWGGSLKSLTLHGEKFQRKQGKESVPIDLVHVESSQPYPLSLVVTPEGGKTDQAMAMARAPMSIVAKDDRSVTFGGRVGGEDVRKTFRLTGKPYEIAMALEVGGGETGTVTVLYPTFMPAQTSSGGFFSGPPLDYVRPICAAEGKVERYDPKGGKEPAKLEGAAGWAGADQHYFVSAVFPAEPSGTCVLASGAVKGTGVAAIALPVEHARKKGEFTVYAGPKELDTLRSYGRSFDRAIDYGSVAQFFAWFARGLLYVMRWLQVLVKNWGVAIILLTLLVRLVLFPLTYKSTQSMNEMRKLQPEIEKLKAKYGEDREKMNMAVMQLYQQHKVNPMGGCLPMLLQMPIWFALYAALQTSVELYQEPFLWIQDLTQKDPYYILPAIMGVSSFLMQKLSPQPADNAQAKMMLYFFPLFFTVIMINVPAGLTLYIAVNNVLSIIQQQVLTKKQEPVVATAK